MHQRKQLVGHWGQKVVKGVFIIKVLLGQCCGHGIPMAFGMCQSTIRNSRLSEWTADLATLPLIIGWALGLESS